MERNTRQRDAIRDAFLRAGRPLGTHEVLVVARDTVPRLGIATVYRNIKTLMEEGWLSEVELPGKPSRYETAGKEHHHHFHCNQCDRVFDLEGCIGTFKALLPRSFRLESHDVLLYGRCADCSRSVQ